MFELKPAHARRCLQGRLMIVGREIANDWPRLIEQGQRPDLMPLARRALDALLALQFALNSEPAEDPLSEVEHAG